jgi:hypothetical protein
MSVCPPVLMGIIRLIRGCALGLRGARSRRLRRYTVEDGCGSGQHLVSADSISARAVVRHAPRQGARGGGAVGATCQQDRKKEGRSQSPASPHHAGAPRPGPTAPAAPARSAPESPTAARPDSHSPPLPLQRPQRYLSIPRINRRVVWFRPGLAPNFETAAAFAAYRHTRKHHQASNYV